MNTQDFLGQFSPEARFVFEEGGAEMAKRLGHPYLETEHILLALVIQEERAFRLFLSMGIDPGKIVSAVEFVIRKGSSRVPARDVGLTPGAKKVAELALNEARRMHSDVVQEEHIMLALVREENGIASDILESLGASPGNIWTHLYNHPYCVLSREECEQLLADAQSAFQENRLQLDLAADALSEAKAALRAAQKHDYEVREAIRASENRIAALERAINLEPQSAP